MLCGSSAAHRGAWLTALRLTLHLPSFASTCLSLVPVLMFVVPPVEIDVKCHNAARGHACNQSPKEQQNHKK